jgi:hypothetical protein
LPNFLSEPEFIEFRNYQNYIAMLE